MLDKQGRFSYVAINEEKKKKRERRYWVSMKRVSIKSLTSLMKRKRLLIRALRRVFSGFITIKTIRAVRAAKPTYDAMSYAKNFDDGQWQMDGND
ncbi:hypothetical protein AMTR_s00022p00162120 [Amborella trichopoda]|uniref:Uncharacterized protein n=1 Tax=Amborella trichopoda TaxID=13333 RepID=W1PV28_AMBTC|nr:hypothetical protein AMTR_s00022p00162120 [Amborella trichopoda]